MLEALIETGGIVTPAAEKAGIGRTTHYRWLDEDPDYEKAVSEVGEICADTAESKLWNLVNHENEKIRLGALKIYLPAKARDRGYGTQIRENKHSGEINGAHTVEVVRAHFPSNGTETDDGPLPESWETNTGL